MDTICNKYYNKFTNSVHNILQKNKYIMDTICNKYYNKFTNSVHNILQNQNFLKFNFLSPNL